MEELTKEEKELQDKLLEEFMNPYYFGSQHDFAARAEINRLRELVGEKHGKAEKGRFASANKSD